MPKSDDTPAVTPSASSVANSYRRRSNNPPMIRTKSSRVFDIADAKYASVIEQKSLEIMDAQYIEMWRLKVKKYMATSWFGKVYTNVLLLLSVVSCALYIAQTYFNGATLNTEASYGDVWLSSWLRFLSNPSIAGCFALFRPGGARAGSPLCL